ncbi:mitochondrial phosphate carrier protein [Mortierella sp. AD011]|nr:mitochondrial phosphate carrier protein [Mortierella sp. AD010]KAF9400654.1 mitochondrial phosphate carrier protein [Mortierella sp. AD011]
MAASFRQVVRNEGVGALMTGAGPTLAGYFVQGGLKFGGYEFWKKTLINYIGPENAANNRTSIYLIASGIAEFFADVALCPLEATRIRLVSQPTFATGLVSGFNRILREEGAIRGFYSGFGPIVFKQVPYSMSKFVVFEHVSEAIFNAIGAKESLSAGAVATVNLAAGLIAGMASAVVSHPADTLLSKVNKTSGTGSIMFRLAGLARELGVRGLFLGLGPRVAMVGTLASLQFAIYGDIKKALGATGGFEIKKV